MIGMPEIPAIDREMFGLPCALCGQLCKKVGTINKIGIRKSLCCECFAKIDKNFIMEFWCTTCSTHAADPFHEIRSRQSWIDMQKEINFFKR